MEKYGFCQALTSKNRLKPLKNHQESNSAEFTLNYNDLSKHYSAEIPVLGGFPAVQTTSSSPDIPSYPPGTPSIPPGGAKTSSRSQSRLPPRPTCAVIASLQPFPGCFSSPRQKPAGKERLEQPERPAGPELAVPVPSAGGSPLTPRLLHALRCQAMEKRLLHAPGAAGQREKQRESSGKGSGKRRIGGCGQGTAPPGEAQPAGPRTGRALVPEMSPPVCWGHTPLQSARRCRDPALAAGMGLQKGPAGEGRKPSSHFGAVAAQPVPGHGTLMSAQGQDARGLWELQSFPAFPSFPELWDPPSRGVPWAPPGRRG